MFDEIKKSLRITNNALDDEIKNNISSALLDMGRVGVVADENSNDKLLIKCVELYCKGEFDYQHNGEKFHIKYEKLRDALSLCATYNGGDKDE